MADILYDNRGGKKNNNLPKVIILTHADADGLVAAMIVKTFEEIENKDKIFIVMSSMDVTPEQTDKTMTYICEYNSLGSKDKIYILDRPIPSISWLKMRYLVDTKLINIDHHITNSPSLYEKENCCSDIEFFWDDKCSAAYLALKYFEEKKDKNLKAKLIYENLKPLAVATSHWDIFSWKNLGTSKEDILNKKRALSINSAEKILGAEAFYKFISKNVDREKYIEGVFSYFFLLHEAYTLKLDAVYAFAKRNIIERNFKKYKMAIIYGVENNYNSILADRIFEDKKNNYDIIVFLTIFGTVSLRSKNDVDVSQIAKQLGEIVGYTGGGHKNASGCRIYDREEIKEKLLNIFEDALKKIEGNS